MIVLNVKLPPPTTSTLLLIIADDLTGTADSAVGCTRAGLTTTVALQAVVTSNAEVVAIDMDSRGCKPAEAASRHREALAIWQGHYRYLYKKVDSTLRGNVAAEIASLVDTAGMAIVAPAYPATGRTTRGGRQWLNGRPVEETEIWTNEGLTGRADLIKMLEASSLRTAHLNLEALNSADSDVITALKAHQRQGIQALVCDAESDDDLRRLATLSARIDGVFWVGSAGLGEMLPEALALADSAWQAAPATSPAPEPEPVRSTLIVIGSMSAISHAQADALVDHAAMLEVVEIEAATLRSSTSKETHDELTRRIVAALADQRDVMVRLSQSGERNAAEGPLLSFALGNLLAPHLANIDRLIATGGATARALLTAAGITELVLIDAPDIGMARLFTDGPQPLEVITKAGGFGAPEALLHVWRAPLYLTHTAQEEICMNERPVIGITMGDAAGVGPEIIVKSLSHDEVYRQCRPLVIGDAERLRDAASRLGSAIEIRAIEKPNEAGFTPGIVDCIDLNLIPADLPYGAVSPIAGDAAYQYIARTVTLTQQGQLDAICTAPLNKAALHAGGHIFPGHTELLAHLTGIDEVSMLLVTPKMKVIHVTTHLGIIDAINRIEPGLVQRTIERAHATLVRAGIDNPRIAVCGINPHAGENGLFGYGEEEEKIMPAINALRSRGWDVEGPLPADTLFFRAGRGDFDCVVAMYHDQGHGPVKVMGLEAGVNVTVGLPVIRTSVDHGTAFDIAGQGLADERSMLEALRQAVELASRRDTRAVE